MIKLEGDLAETGCPPQIIDLATAVEDFAIDHLLTNIRVFRQSSVGDFIIEIEDHGRSNDLTVTIKEFDL